MKNKIELLIVFIVLFSALSATQAQDTLKPSSPSNLRLGTPTPVPNILTVCSSGCQYSSLQAAFDQVQCGEVIQIRSTDRQVGNFVIRYRGDCSQNPIKVTTDREAWLPPSGTRITPSHLENLAIIATHNAYPAINGNLDGGKRPPAGWTFRGVAITTQHSGSHALIDLAGLNTPGVGYNPASDAELPSNIVFDQCYLYGPLPGASGTVIQNMIRANGRNVVIKNSYFGDAAWPGVETHGILLWESDTVTIENNYITASSIPIFSGGGMPGYVIVPHNITVRYNYSYRPWKWNSDPAQPYAADYAANARDFIRWVSSEAAVKITNVTNGGVITLPEYVPFYNYSSVVSISGVKGCVEANRSDWRVVHVSGASFQLLNFPGCSASYSGGGEAVDHSYQVCTKNLGELKVGDTVLWQYNVGENSWKQTQCHSQSTGFTNTLRPYWVTDLNPLEFRSKSEIAWMGNAYIWNYDPSDPRRDDIGLCAWLPDIGAECRRVTSFDNNQKTLQVSPPFSSSPSGSTSGWLSYTASARLTNLTLTNNVWKNVSQGMTNLALAPSNGEGDAGFGKNHTIRNNLWWNNSTYMDSYTFLELMAGETYYVVKPTQYSFVNNTYYSVAPMSLAFIWVHGSHIWDHLTLSNNLVGPSSKVVAFGGDGIGSLGHAVSSRMVNSMVQNNVIPGVLSPNNCTGTNACSGNIADAWSDPFTNSLIGDFRLKAGSVPKNKGTDGKDIGADFNQLPLINNLKVIASQRSAKLEFDVTPVIAGVKNLQPCVLEVSSSRNLHSGLGSYATLPDLNPVLFKQPDNTRRINPKLSSVTFLNNHVTWPIGSESTGAIQPDNGGSPVDLRLTPGTTYYGRVMCYGDTQWFKFKTATGAQRLLNERIATTQGTTNVRVSYGAQSSLSSNSQFTPQADGLVTIEVPLENSGITSYKVELLKGSQVIGAGPVQSYQ